MGRITNRRQVFEAIAQSLRDFGYAGAPADQVKDTWEAMWDDKPIPHGVIGAFAESQLKNHRGAIATLKP